MRLIDADALGVGRCSRDVLPADYCAGWNGLIRLLEKAPTVDAVPVVHGRWEKEPSSYWRWTSSGAVAVTRTTYRCGLCGRGTAVKSNYCPNCGAKMDGGAEK